MLILIPVIIILVILFIIIAFIANKNIKAMNCCISSALNEIKNYYQITQCDPGEYKEIKMKGIMKFKVEQYSIKDIGNLSIMRVNMGFMQMATFVITPKDKNLPLFSADYIYILSKRKSYLEFYDVVEEKDEQYNELLNALSEVKNKYNHLENFQASTAWYQDLLTVDTYKATKADADNEIEQMLVDNIKVYMKHSHALPLFTFDKKARKLAITVEYTNGLIEKGGVSTEVFKKELGNEETKKFFDSVFFGTSLD